MVLARRAGRNPAPAATTARIISAAAAEAISVALRPNNCVETYLLTASAANRRSNRNLAMPYQLNTPHRGKGLQKIVRTGRRTLWVRLCFREIRNQRERGREVSPFERAVTTLACKLKNLVILPELAAFAHA